jgi:hypothetical protein
MDRPPACPNNVSHQSPTAVERSDWDMADELWTAHHCLLEVLNSLLSKLYGKRKHMYLIEAIHVGKGIIHSKRER